MSLFAENADNPNVELVESRRLADLERKAAAIAFVQKEGISVRWATDGGWFWYRDYPQGEAVSLGINATWLGAVASAMSAMRGEEMIRATMEAAGAEARNESAGFIREHQERTWALEAKVARLEGALKEIAISRSVAAKDTERLDWLMEHAQIHWFYYTGAKATPQDPLADLAEEDEFRPGRCSRKAIDAAIRAEKEKP